MKKLTEILSNFKSMYAAQRALGVRDTTLVRLEAKGAMVDDDGNIWIKSKTVLSDCITKRLNESLTQDK